MARHPLPRGTVDFHTHILPIDHGSRDTAMAAAQMRLLQEAGLSAVVATPHFYAHSEKAVADFIARRDAAARDLLAAVWEDAPTLYLGAEVLVTRGLSEMEDLPQLAIRGTDVILLEMPLGGWSDGHLREVERIASRGLVPMLAHLDRYPIPWLESLYDDPRYLYQVNLGGLLGIGARARYFRRMLAAGAVAALGSDLHGLPSAGYRRYLKALSRAGDALLTVNEHTAEILATATPAEK